MLYGTENVFYCQDITSTIEWMQVRANNVYQKTWVLAGGIYYA